MDGAASAAVPDNPIAIVAARATASLRNIVVSSFSQSSRPGRGACRRMSLSSPLLQEGFNSPLSSGAKGGLRGL
jgi:hypothetical protein